MSNLRIAKRQMYAWALFVLLGVAATPIVGWMLAHDYDPISTLADVIYWLQVKLHLV